jgi:hypothetical protein
LCKDFAGTCRKNRPNLCKDFAGTCRKKWRVGWRELIHCACCSSQIHWLCGYNLGILLQRERERETLYILGLGEWVGLYSTMGHWAFCSIMGHQLFYICNIIFILHPFNRYFSCIYIILDISIAIVQNA